MVIINNIKADLSDLPAVIQQIAQDYMTYELFREYELKNDEYELIIKRLNDRVLFVYSSNKSIIWRGSYSNDIFIISKTTEISKSLRSKIDVKKMLNLLN